MRIVRSNEKWQNSPTEDTLRGMAAAKGSVAARHVAYRPVDLHLLPTEGTRCSNTQMF